MPIYEQAYRRWEARGPLRSLRFWPITREALAILLQRRAFVVLLMMGWIPFVIRVGHVYVVTRFPQVATILPADGRLFGEFLNQQTPFTILLSIFGGAGLVANDLRTGAILVYLSRPLTRRDYVIGKLSVLLALNFAATLVPGLLLYAVALGLAPEQFATLGLAWIAPMIVVHATLLSLVVSLVALAVSAVSRSARVAGLAFAGLVVGLEIARGVLEGILDRPEARVLSLQNDLRILGNLLFGVAESGGAVPAIYPVVVLALTAAGCLAILRARVRAVEIVR